MKAAAALALLLAWPAAAAEDDGYASPQPEQIDALIQSQDRSWRVEHPPECWMLPCTARDIQAYDKANGPGAFDSTHRAGHVVIARELRSGEPEPTLKQELTEFVTDLKRVVQGRINLILAQETPKTPEGRAMLETAKRMIEEGRRGLQRVDVGGRSAEALLIRADKRQGYLNSIVTASPSPRGELDRIARRGRADPSVLNQVGNYLLRQNDPKAARDSFNKALSLESGNADALTGRAAAHMDLKNFRDAAADAKEALRYNPKDPAAQAIAKLAHDRVAEGYSAKAVGFANLPQTRDVAVAVLGNPASPLSGLTAADGSALQSSAYARQALRELSMGDAAAAVRSADRAVELDSRSADAFGLRAFAEARAGRYEDALRDAVAALALDSNNILAHNARAKALNAMGLYREGLAAAEDALRADRGNAYAQYMRAMAYNGLGERASAIAALERAAKLDARFQDAVDLARATAEEKDLGFLFPEESLAAAKALLAGRALPRPRLKLTLPMLLGAGLVLGGLLHLLLWPVLRRVASRLGRRGPALGKNATVAGLSIPGSLSLAGPGVVLRGQYRRLGQIGSSVQGTVYEGVDLSLDRPVAIRKLRGEMRASDQERLLVPARQAAALSHPGIASLYAVLEEPDALYLISEFARGRTLRDCLAARGPLPASEALPLFRKAAAALDYAHAHGVCHGAIRASNLIVGPDGGAKLVDFGLLRGPAECAADLQAFAACLREAIAGLPPAQLDAIDGALARERPRLRDAAHVIATIETALPSSAS